MFKPSTDTKLIYSLGAFFLFLLSFFNELSAQVTINSVDTKTGSAATVHSLTSVPAGALLVLTTSAASAQQNCTVSSSPSLTWTKRIETTANNSGDAEIYTAIFSAGGTISVTSNWGNQQQASACFVVTGQESTLAGASASATSQQFPSVAITTTRDNSILFCVTSDWNAVDGNSSRTYRNSPVERIYYRNVNNFTTYHYTKSMPTAGATTMGLTAPDMRANSINGGGTAVLEIRSPIPTDTQAPTAPTNLAATYVGATQINLSWTASTDNVGVTGYEIYANSNLITTTTNLTYNLTGLTNSTQYSIYVRAKDAAGNGTNSSTLTLTTLSSDFWTVVGNTGNNSSKNFLGTTDSAKLVIKTFNKQRASIWENGVVNIGLNDTASRPAFRVYPNGDFIANANNKYNDASSMYKNGIRYHSRLGYLEVGVSSIIDTTVSQINGPYETSAIILNTDSRGNIAGQLQNAFVGAYNVQLPAGKWIYASMLTGGSYFLNASLQHVVGGGVYHTITGDVNGSLIMGNSQAITKPDDRSGWFGYNNRNANGYTSGNITGGWINNIGAPGQLTVGGYLTNKSVAATALGNANVDFTSLPYNSYDSIFVSNTQNIAPGGLLFSIGNSNSKTGATKSNAISVLYNGRTQINTTGFSNNLTEANVTPKAAFEVVSTNSGVLLPKLTTSQRNGIASGDLYSGLLLYNTDSSSFQFYNGSSWQNMGAGSSGNSTSWALGGNAGTNANNNFIGTTDGQPVVFKVGNVQRMKLNTDGVLTYTSGDSQTSGIISSDNAYGNWFNINSHSAYNATGSGIRLTINDTNKTQIFHNDNAFSLGGSFDVLSGNAEMLSRHGDVYLSTGTFRSNGLIVKYSTGNVGIGTYNPQSKLAVNGDILAKKVKVTQTGWADYVFYPQYKLPTLKEVEAFIEKNQHLPDVPSAEEVEKKGLDLGDNQAVLLKKIEELTLYLIEINKKVDKLSEENAALKKKLDAVNK